MIDKKARYPRLTRAAVQHMDSAGATAKEAGTQTACATTEIANEATAKESLQAFAGLVTLVLLHRATLQQTGTAGMPAAKGTANAEDEGSHAP